MTRWQRRKAAGLCPRCGRALVHATSPRLSCQRCAERQHQYHATVVAPGRVKAREWPGPAHIAHCGQWWLIKALPWHCPQCQTILGLSLEEPASE